MARSVSFLEYNVKLLTNALYSIVIDMQFVQLLRGGMGIRGQKQNDSDLSPIEKHILTIY
jgi:hypothetical protein